MWYSRKLMQTRRGRNPAPKRVKTSSSASDSDSVSDSSSSSAMESAEAAGVHGSKSAPSSDPECGPNPALSLLKCGKTLETAHAQHQHERAKKKTKPLNPVLGGNLEDLHCVEPECQRDLLHQALLNRDTTMRNWNVNVLLHKPAQRRIGYDRRHYHQLSVPVSSSNVDDRTGNPLFAVKPQQCVVT